MDFRDLIYPPGATQRDWLLDGALAATLMLMQVASAIILGPPYYPGTAWELLVCLGMLGALTTAAPLSWTEAARVGLPSLALAAAFTALGALVLARRDIRA